MGPASALKWTNLPKYPKSWEYLSETPDYAIYNITYSSPVLFAASQSNLVIERNKYVEEHARLSPEKLSWSFSSIFHRKSIFILLSSYASSLILLSLAAPERLDVQHS